jgi:hypothetical protein
MYADLVTWQVSVAPVALILKRGDPRGSDRIDVAETRL